MRSPILVLLVNCLAVPALAATYGTAQTEFSRNVDKVEQARLNISSTYGRFDVLWPFENETESVETYGLSVDLFKGRSPLAIGGEQTYSAVKPTVTLGKKWSPRVSASAALGWLSFENSTTGDKSSTGAGHAKATYMTSETSWLTASLEKSFLLEEMILARNVRDPIGVLTVKATSNVQATETWKITSVLTSRSIADGNSRNEVDVAGMYAFSRYPTWFWVGVGLDQVNYSRAAADYYSPESSFAIGPRIDFAKPIRERLTVKFGGSVNYVKEASRDAATGSYFRAAIEWGSREDDAVEFAVIDSRSGQTSSSWSSQSVTLGGHWAF